MDYINDLVVFLAGARLLWRTPQEGLIPSERWEWLASFEQSATSEVVDLTGGSHGLLVDAYAHLIRGQFLTMLAEDFGAISRVE